MIASTNPKQLPAAVGRLSALPPSVERIERRRILDAAREAFQVAAAAAPIEGAGTALLEAYASAGFLVESVAMARAAEDLPGRAAALAKVVEAAPEASGAERIDVAREALEAALGVKTWERGRLLDSIFAAAARGADAATVSGLLKQVSNPEEKISCLTASIGSFAARGDVASAMAGAREAILQLEAAKAWYTRRSLVTALFEKFSTPGLSDVSLDLVRSLAPGARVAALIEIVRSGPDRSRRPALAREAARLADGIAEGYERNSALGDLATALSDGGAADVALDIARETAASGRVAMLSGLVSSGNGRRNVVSATLMASEALKAARDINSEWERRRAHGEILVAFAPEHADVAKALAAEIADERDRSEAMAGLVGHLLRLDDKGPEAFSLAKETVSPEARGRALIKCTQYLLERGSRVRAREMAKDALVAILQISSDYERKAAMTALIEALWNRKLVRFARELAENITVSARRAEALGIVAERLSDESQLDEALELAQSLKGLSEADEPLSKVSSAMLKNGRFDNAAELALCLPEEFYVREGALDAVVQECVKAGLYSLASEVARAKRDNGGAGQLATIAGAMAKAGDVDGAVRLAQSITGAVHQTKALTTIARAAVRRGAIDQAEAALAAARTAGESIGNYDEHARGTARIAAVLADLTRYEEARVSAERCHLANERIWASTAILRNYVASRRPEFAVPLAETIAAEI